MSEPGWQPIWVFMLRCADGSYCRGRTISLESRIGHLLAGVVPGCTAQRLPVQLVWCEQCDSRGDALAVERQLAGWCQRHNRRLHDLGRIP